MILQLIVVDLGTCLFWYCPGCVQAESRGCREHLERSLCRSGSLNTECPTVSCQSCRTQTDMPRTGRDWESLDKQTKHLYWLVWILAINTLLALVGVTESRHSHPDENEDDGDKDDHQNNVDVVWNNHSFYLNWWMIKLLTNITLELQERAVAKHQLPEPPDYSAVTWLTSRNSWLTQFDIFTLLPQDLGQDHLGGGKDPGKGPTDKRITSWNIVTI